MRTPQFLKSQTTIPSSFLFPYKFFLIIYTIVFKIYNKNCKKYILPQQNHDYVNFQNNGAIKNVNSKAKHILNRKSNFN